MSSAPAPACTIIAKAASNSRSLTTCHDQDLPSDGPTCRLQPIAIQYQLPAGSGPTETAMAAAVGNQFVQQLQLLSVQISTGKNHAREVSAGPAEAGDKAYS